MQAGPVNKDRTGNVQVHQVHVAICSAQREWKESTELRHSFSKSWFVNKICAMNSYARLWFYDAPQKKIYCKPSVILYWDKLQDFSNKHLYSKNVLLAISKRYIKRKDVKRKDNGKQCVQYWSSLCRFLKRYRHMLIFLKGYMS